MKLAALFAFVMLICVAGRAEAMNVGFEALTIANGAEKPLQIGIWYPTEASAKAQPLGLFTQTVAAGAAPAAGSHPLIVMSHGAGGSYEGHYDTAGALAEAGFVVAAVSHTGDTYDDQSQAARIWTRSNHIYRLVDYMLAEWPRRASVDVQRVGMFGFSAGGFTTLVIAGGAPDLRRVPPHCVAHPDYFDCGVVKTVPDLASLIASLPPSVWVHDPRVKAGVVAAPALGFTFGREGLKDVRIPIQLWRAEDDHILPNPDYAEAVRANLPRPPEFHLVKNGDHFDFLAPCSDALRQAAPDICVSRAGFDRVAFHRTFNREVVGFFERTLK